MQLDHQMEATSVPAPSVLREVMALQKSPVAEDSPVKQATDLWFDLCNTAGGIPDFSTFQPFKHPKLLPHLSLFERIGNRYRCNLIGESARYSLPAKIARRFLDEILPEEIAEDITARFDRAHADGLPNYVERRMNWSSEHDFMHYRVLNTPFVCSKNDSRRIMSVIDFETPFT